MCKECGWSDCVGCGGYSREDIEAAMKKFVEDGEALLRKFRCECERRCECKVRRSLNTKDFAA